MMRGLRLAAILPWLLVLAACGPDTSEDALSRTDKTKLETTDVKVGTGAEAREGRRVSVHYTGWLYHPTREGHKGRTFDSSRDRNEPFTLTLGAGEVIPGWDQGLLGMKEGGTRTLVIPPRLAYGPTGAPPAIPPNATLVFDIELLKVE
ncbi:MAG TPA: FKBP-type peptidyl-prolyl cis-trans isomerase [Vicinamibacterales bacterium]